ncbi:uncharacterized protein LOC144152446 [Haemaphysalis longicornis]
MAPYHFLVTAVVVVVTAFRSDATSYDDRCYGTSECRNVEYVECGSTQWYCPWSAGGHWEHDDMTDCKYGVHGCVQDWCSSVPISRTCVPSTTCGTGYTFNTTSKQCVDIDECATITHTCRDDQTCENRRGGFTCKCPVGYRVTPSGCEDINECVRSFGRVCCFNSECINTPGSYECQCRPGFEKGANGQTCIDVNECVTNRHNCEGNQTCVNRHGGFDCKCPLGYRKNTFKDCIDIDECTSSPGRVCRGQSECVNTPGSYFCQCKEGFRRGFDAHTCIDVDECQEDAHDCHHRCINVWGSFRCSCHSGFHLAENNRTCLGESTDCPNWGGFGGECVNPCVNNPGSCSCPDGFVLSSNGRSCNDINECEQGDVCPGEDEVCVNTMGAYRCSMVHCPHGFTRDSYRKTRCRRVNVNRDCCVDTVACREHPLSVTYSHVALTHNLKLPPSGQQSFFHLRGPRSGYSSIDFDLELVDATTSSSDSDVELATRDHFLLERTSSNEAIVSLVKPLQGPQDVELELRTTVSHHGRCSGTTVSKIFIFVSGKNF